jgi:antitoxin CcdA
MTPVRPPRATDLDPEANLAAEARSSYHTADGSTRRWREENHGALLSCNAWVEEYGLPLAKYRMF